VKIIVSVIVTVIKTRMDGTDSQARDKLEPQSNIVQNMSSSKKPQMSQDSHWLLFLVTFVIKIYAIIITTKILKPAKTITRLILAQTFTYSFFIGSEFFLPKNEIVDENPEVIGYLARKMLTQVDTLCDNLQTQL